MSGLRGYDQWKTASPYDDEPDVCEDLGRVCKDISHALNEWESLQTPLFGHVRILLERARDTMSEAEEWITENI